MKESLKELQTKNKYLNQRLNSLQSDMEGVRKQISENQKLINDLTKSKVVISEHAILRILERRYGQEEMIKKVTESLENEIGDCPKNCKLRIDGNLEAVIKNGVLITVTPL